MKKEIIPLLILILISIYCIIIVSTTNTLYSSNNYIGHLLVLVSAISFFINKRVYKYIITGTLILGILGFLNFTPTIYSINFLGITFHPLPLIILIIHYYLTKTTN